MNATTLPKLAAPGAGLPKLELYAARLMFRNFRRKQNPGTLNELISKEKAEMLKLVETFDEGKGRTRVLIDRIRGLEDSSRNWSVYMTLEHVRIVNSNVIDIMSSLANAQVPEGKASTGDVKPEESIGGEVIDSFAASCDQLTSCVEGINDLDRPEKYAHPWFGPLTIRDWYAMAAFHIRLHHKQVEAILKNME